MQNKTIAVVDDSITSLNVANNILSEMYDTYTVPSAEGLFNLLKTVKPDLILLDVIMPVMDGYEAAKILKSNDDYKDIPIIFLTGVTNQRNEIEGFTLGAVDYIHKPFDSAILLRRIQTHLSLFDHHAVLKKEKSDALLAAKTKSEILAFMSHELRSPLTAVIGMLEFAKSTEDPVKKKNYVEKAEKASKLLLELINDVLDISKIEANKLELTNKEFSVNRMLQNIINVINVHVERKNQKLVVNIDKNVPLFLIGDELRLSQVLINLLSNAVKFTPEKGTVILDIRTIDESENEATIKFKVEDNGIGISDEQKERLFTTYGQASIDISHKFGGTGLGLVISKSIVELMDGRIWVESKIGEGSKFIFKINARIGTGETLATASSKIVENHEGNRYNFSECTILAAEDNEINREIILTMLEQTNAKVDFSVNGAEAVRVFKESPGKYSIIFMDVFMPEMDGYDATKCIRSSGVKGAEEIPIIAMTANANKEETEKCLESGMNGHIKKPFNYDEILKTLHNYLKNA